MSISRSNALRGLRLAAPALGTGLLAFNAGGFFPGTTSTACILVGLGLVLRLTLADRPWEGWSPALGIAAGALASLAVWILVSSSWSDAAGRAILEFDRALLYGLVLVLFGLFAARATDLATLLRWVAAVFCLVCIAGLATRLLPGTFPTDRAIASDRLIFPLTYWNAMGIAATLALVLALHVAASAREPAVARVLAAAALPAVAVALYFTFSRGGIAVAFIGVALYLVLGHPRGLIGVLAAVGPAGYYALHEAYDADLLASAQFANVAASGQREHLIVVVAGCMLVAGAIRALALLLDRRIAGVHLPEHRRRPVWLAVWAVAAVAVVAAVVITDLPHRLDQERKEFSQGAILPGSSDLRDRLTQTGNNGRIANWRVARDAFEEKPAYGWGAGTYRLLWEQNRPQPPFQVTDGHSLYLEVAAELGAVGLALLLVVLLTPLAVAAARLRRPEHHACAAFVAAGAALLIHAGVDWDWEMPALFGWFFAASGVLLAARDPRPAPSPGRLTRVGAGLAVLGLLLTPALVAAGEAPLKRGVLAFERRDCRTAIDAALDSIDVLSARAEPYEILGYCDARAGQNALAVRAMRNALRRDPDNWQFAYGLAAVQALAGEDPTAAARLAVRLNPLDARPRALERGLRSRSLATRRRVAARVDIPFE